MATSKNPEAELRVGLVRRFSKDYMEKEPENPLAQSLQAAIVEDDQAEQHINSVHMEMSTMIAKAHDGLAR